MTGQPSLFGSDPSAELIPFEPSAPCSNAHSEPTGYEQSAWNGIKVKLARNVDAEKPCHDNLAVIRPGKAQHAGELRCATCGAFRGWLSQTTHDFISETVRRLGAPVEPIIVRQEEKRPMAFQQKDNTGSVFANTHKTEEKHPDSTGTAKIGGVEYKIAVWRRESKNGKKYLSLSFEPKEKARGAFRSGADHFNDEIGI